MNDEPVSRSQTGPVQTLLMQRPRAANALNSALRAALAAALREVAADPAVRVVVLGGAGRVFCAGADLREPTPADVEAQVIDEYKPVFDAIIESPKPVIAAISGVAAGIGLSLALACDLVVMADDAALVAPFSLLGLVPDGGASWLLVRQLGYRRAYQLAIEAERIDARRALEWGLVNRVEPSECLLERAQRWAAELAERSPVALAGTKNAMHFAASAGYFETFAHEARLQAHCAASADFREGVAAFLEKRKPGFRPD